jgi:hypothetical protein
MEESEITPTGITVNGHFLPKRSGMESIPSPKISF